MLHQTSVLASPHLLYRRLTAQIKYYASMNNVSFLFFHCLLLNLSLQLVQLNALDGLKLLCFHAIHLAIILGVRS